MDEAETGRERQLLIDVVKFLIVFASYFAGGKIGLVFASFHPSATAIWPPTGIAIASMLLFGYKKAALAVLLAAFVVNYTTSQQLLSSIGIAFGNTLEALVAAFLIFRFAGGKFVFQKTGNVFKFTLFAALLSPLLSATVGVVSLFLNGELSLEMIQTVWLTWYLGDVGGALIVAPFIVIWSERFRFVDLKLNKMLECVVLLIILEIAGDVVFKNMFPFPFVILPILVWIAFRFGARGGSLAMVVISTIAIYYTLLGNGPFAANAVSLNQSLLLMQFFLGLSTIMTLVLAVALREGKEAEVLVEHSEQRVRALIEKSKDGLALINREGFITYAGPSTEKLLGFKAAELVGKNAMLFVHSADKEMIAHTLNKLILMPLNSEVAAEYRTTRKDGEVRWISAIGTNYLSDPLINAVVVNYHDITRRKLAEEKIAREKVEYQALIESIGEGIVATDTHGRIVLVNRSLVDMIGYFESELLGKNTTELLKMQDDEGETISEDVRPLNLAMSERRKVTKNYAIERKNGTIFPALIVASPVMLNDQIIGGIKVIRDITEEKEIDRAKSEFVATASHQLRTPLGIAKWYLEAIEGEEYFKHFPKEAQEYIDTVYKSNERLLYIVRSLLNVAKIESGHVKDDPKMVNAALVIKEVVERNKVEADKRRLVITVVDQSFGAEILIDPRRFAEVIENLLSNAIKYTKQGSEVTVGIVREKDQIIISIKDHGIGIAEKDRRKIFSKFFRAENAVRTETVGSGLGLYLVKSYVYSWQGVVWFDSIEGQGTTFFVKLPLGAPK